MSGINGVGNNNPIHRVVSQPILRQVEAEPAGRLQSSDKLELSGVSHLLTNLRKGDVRTDKITSIRAQLEAGTYEDDHKLNVAIDRLIDDLAL